MDTQSKLESLRTQIALKLIEIENITRERNVPMENITLIARDPDNDEMFVVVTNETREGLDKAGRVIIQAGKEEEHGKA